MLLQAIPDPTPFLSRGTLGALVFLVVVFVLAGVFVTIKVFTLQAKKNGHSNGSALQEAQRQLDSIRAGSQPVEFWVRKYDESAERANQPLLIKLDMVIRDLNKIRKSQQTILNAMKRAKIVTDADLE